MLESRWKKRNRRPSLTRRAHTSLTLRLPRRFRLFRRDSNSRDKKERLSLEGRTRPMPSAADGPTGQQTPAQG